MRGQTDLLWWLQPERISALPALQACYADTWPVFVRSAGKERVKKGVHKDEDRYAQVEDAEDMVHICLAFAVY